MSYTSLKLWHRRNTTCSSCFKKKARRSLGTKTETKFKEVLQSGTTRRWETQHSNKMWTSAPSALKFKVQPLSSVWSGFENFRKKHNIFMTFFSIFGNWTQIFFWQSTDFAEWTHFCSTPWPSALRCVGGDRSSHSPMATGQPPGPSGRFAHPWTRSSSMPHITPWIQAAQALGRSERGCKGCELLCEVFLSSSVTSFKSLLTSVRPQILEAAIEGGTWVATTAYWSVLSKYFLSSDFT